MTVKEIQKKLLNKEISSYELTNAYLEKIKRFDGDINAFITVSEENALMSAKAADQIGDFTGLAGIPFAVKDNICTKGIATTCASRILEGFIPEYDATAVKKLKQNGAIVIGKTNLDEFGMGSTTENSALFPTKNPANLLYSPGGSSGGSAAAVAAGFVPFALGTDTGGSVRQPASHCGVYGFCPTYGLISRFGLIAFASSLDRIGILASNAEDCREVFLGVCGKDRSDSTSSDWSATNEAAIKDIQKMRIAVPKEVYQLTANPDIRAALDKTVKVFESLGATVEYAEMPSLKYALPAYYIISSAEASSNLARFDGIRYGKRAEEFSGLDDMYIKTRSEGFGDEVKRRIMLGTFALSAGCREKFYKKAITVREMIKEEYRKLFERFDLILSPVTPDTAPKLGDSPQSPVKRYESDIFTVTSSLAGLPAISVPIGTSYNVLPVGIQLTAGAFCEDTLFSAATALGSAVNGEI